MNNESLFAEILLKIGEAIDTESGNDDEYKLETELKLEEVQVLLREALGLGSDFQL